MSEYADQHAHDVFWMTAREREDYHNQIAEIDRIITEGPVA